MNNINVSLNYAMALHSKLARTLPMTNYNLYCRRVHKCSSYSASEKWRMILQWDINPTDYSNPTLFGADYQLKNLAAKLSFGGVPTDEDKDFAYAKFQSAETRCESFNEMLTTGVRPRGLQELLPEIQRIVTSVLGPIGDFFNWVESSPACAHHSLSDQFTLAHGRVDAVTSGFDPKFGPGVSVGRDFKLQSLSEKLVYGTVTAQCAYLANWISGIWRVPTPTIVEGSVLTFVPKRVGEARTICYEPSMNMLIQKLLGSYIKHRMKCALGIDLSDQSKNRELARLGSLCDSYATIDLSSASDLMSKWFVTEVTPYPWLRLLDDARSKSFFDPMKNEWTRFHKFSTMGNGFTFELETLMFAAITLAAVRVYGGNTLSRDEYAVYGDDIIVPKAHALIVLQSLAICGHIPNLSKTYTSGPFRESCGGEFFNGWEVTPLKIKDLDIYDTKSLVTLHNRCISIHRLPNHVGYLSCWLARLRVSLHICASDVEARLAEGPIESYIDNRGVEIFCSSDRYLWSEDHPSTWKNSRWSKKLHSWVPARFLIMTYDKTIEYDMHPDVVPYAIGHGSISCCRFKINEHYSMKRNSSAFS